MRLVIKMPTRSRPSKFKTLLETCISFLSDKHEIRFVVTCDEDDKTMNNIEIREWLSHLQKTVDLVYHYGNSTSKVQAVNADLENEHGDVLLVISDDMIPVVQNYDDIIAMGYDQLFPNYDGAIKFNDGIRKDHLMTLPCLGWKLYEAFGYIYHPDYESLYCDNEQTLVCEALNKFATCEACIIKHQWVPGNHPIADDLHKRNESFYDQDGIIYKKRFSEKFDYDTIQKRLNS